MSSPRGAQRSEAKNIGTGVTVSNLPGGGCTAAQLSAKLSAVFSKFGPIVDLVIESSGEAIITYETKASANGACTSSDIDIDGRVVNVAPYPPARCGGLGITLDGRRCDSIFKGFSQGLSLAEGSKETRRKFSLGHIINSESPNSKASFSFSLASQTDIGQSVSELPNPIAGTKHQRPDDFNDLPDYESDLEILKSNDFPTTENQSNTTIAKKPHPSVPVTTPMQKQLFSERRSSMPHSLKGSDKGGVFITLEEASSMVNREEVTAKLIDTQESSSMSLSFQGAKHTGAKIARATHEHIDSQASKIDLSHLSCTSISPDPCSGPTAHSLSRDVSPKSSGSSLPCSPNRLRSSPDPISYARPPIATTPSRQSPSPVPINATAPGRRHPSPLPVVPAVPYHTRLTPQSSSPAKKMIPTTGKLSPPPKLSLSPSHSPLTQTPGKSPTSLSIAARDNEDGFHYDSHPLIESSSTTAKSSTSAKSRIVYPTESHHVSPPPSLHAHSSQESFQNKSSSKKAKSLSPQALVSGGLSLSHLKESVKPQPSSRSIPVPNPIVLKVLMHDSQTKKDMRKIKSEAQVSEVKILPPPSTNPSSVPTISITGEAERIEKALSLVKDKLLQVKRQIQTKNYCMDALYSPLFMTKDSEIFKAIKKIEDESCVTFSVQRANGKTYPFSMFSSFVQQDSGSLLKVPELRRAKLLISPMSWSIQSFSGNWWPWPVAANEYLNKCLRESIKSFEYTDTENGIVYRIDLNKMEAVDTRQGLVHALKAEPSQTCTWRGVIPYTDTEATEIEMCLRDGLVKSINCSGRRCYFDFHSLMEIDASDGQATIVKREPNIPFEYLNPRIKIVAQGLSVNRAIPQLDSLFQSRLEEEVVPLPGGSDRRKTHPSLMVQFVQQYCVRGTSSALGDTIRIQGIDRNYIAKVIVELMKNIGLIQFAPSGPSQMSNFQTPVGWCPQVRDTEVFNVVQGSQDWDSIVELWHQTCSREILRIQRIQSRWLWRQYALSRERLVHKNNGRHNEMLLFHGTSSTDPADIYNSEKGFDARFSRPGLWGTGIYFAVNASYSVEGYYHERPDKTRQVFLAKVLTGDSVVLGSSRALKMPPLKDSSTFGGSSERYDSVKGQTTGSGKARTTEVYIVYDQDKAYPEYLITFTVR